VAVLGAGRLAWAAASSAAIASVVVRGEPSPEPALLEAAVEETAGAAVVLGLIGAVTAAGVAAPGVSLAAAAGLSSAVGRTGAT
jgi:hypothetical protein